MNPRSSPQRVKWGSRCQTLREVPGHGQCPCSPVSAWPRASSQLQVPSQLEELLNLQVGGDLLCQARHSLACMCLATPPREQLCGSLILFLMAPLNVQHYHALYSGNIICCQVWNEQRVHSDLESITCWEWQKNRWLFCNLIEGNSQKVFRCVKKKKKAKPEANPDANRKGVADSPCSLCIGQELIILDSIRRGEDQTLGKLCSDKQLNVD